MTRTVFFGTPAEAIPVLSALTQVSEVEAVVTRPDRPSGRGLAKRASLVKSAAEAWGLPVVHPSGASEVSEAVEGCDVAVVAAYGMLIPGDALRRPRAGFLNVHFSLLPRWRGASPVVRAILAGDEETGVTLMAMDEGLDTGPVVAARSIPIGGGDTAGTLTARLASLGAGMIVEHLDDYVQGRLAPVAQDDAHATAAGKVTVQEAFIDPKRHSAEAVVRAVRAFNPRPGAWGVVDGKRVRVLAAAVVDDAGVAPGMAVVDEGRVVLGTAGGAVLLHKVQPEGRSVMDAGAWMHGRRGEPARFSRPG